MWNVADTLAISADQRRTLQAWIAAGSTPQKVVFRSRIVLLAAEGMANRKIAQQLHTSRPTVILWRRRFKVGGPAALTKDAAGRGRKPRIPPEKVEQILEATLKTTPLGATRWSVRTMAAAQGVSPATVQRIWQTQGLGTRRNADFGPNKRLLEKSNDSYSVGETARIEPIAENLKPSKVVLETAAGAQRFKRVSRLEWEDYPNYAARMEFLLALRNKWPKFWCSLNATWRSQDPTRLEQWTREYHVINEDERLSNRWLLDDVVLPTLAYWSESPDSPDARLQPTYPWFCYPPDRFLPFPEFRPVLTDARPRPIAPVADFKGR